MRIEKITRDQLISDNQTEYDTATQTWTHGGCFMRVDGKGSGVAACVKLSTSVIEGSPGAPPEGTPEFTQWLDVFLEERVALDLQEINGEGPFEGIPFDEDVMKLREALCLETIL